MGVFALDLFGRGWLFCFVDIDICVDARYVSSPGCEVISSDSVDNSQFIFQVGQSYACAFDHAAEHVRYSVMRSFTRSD